jgi:hypothetical protein
MQQQYTREKGWFQCDISYSQHKSIQILISISIIPADRLCGLVVRVLDYRYRGPGFDSRALQKKVVGLERGALSLVRKMGSYLIEK